MVSSAPSSPTVSTPPLSSLQLRLRDERLAAKRSLESSPLWLEWRAAVERLQALQNPNSSASSPFSSSPASSPPHRSNSIADASIAPTPPSVSPSSSPASSVSSLSSSSAFLTPEALLSLSDGFDLLDGCDPVFVEQRRVHAQMAAQQRVDGLKAELVRSAEWRGLIKVNEELRMEAKREIEGLRASLRSWTATSASSPPSPPLPSTESPSPPALPSSSLPSLQLSLAEAEAAEPFKAAPSAAPACATPKGRAVAAPEEPFTPPSSVSASTHPSPSSASTAATSASFPSLLSSSAATAPRPVAAMSHPLHVRPLTSILRSSLPPSLHLPPLPQALMPQTIGPSLPPSTLMHSAAVHPHPMSSLIAPPVPSPYLSTPTHSAPYPIAAPRFSAFSSVRSKAAELSPAPVALPATAPIQPPPRFAVGVAQAARVVPSHPPSSSGRHAAGDPSRLRSPAWCSGLIEDPHQVVPLNGLGLTSPDVHLHMCGSEKHQLQRLWSRPDGRSVLSALLRALTFDTERHFEHPTLAAVEDLRRDLRRTVEQWSDAQFAAALPRHLQGCSRIDYLHTHLSPHADPIDPSLLWLWRAATAKAPRVYLISVALPVKAAAAVPGQVKDEGEPAGQPALGKGASSSASLVPALHSLRLQVLGDASPTSSTPCIILYQNLCGPVAHHEALAWKKGTRGPSRLKTLLTYQEPIIAALEMWQRQRQQQRQLTRKRKRVEGGEVGGDARSRPAFQRPLFVGGAVAAVQPLPAHPPLPQLIAADGG